jgi:hypothetical protein
MLDHLELSLMAFPQSWTAATQTLALNLLVLPVGDPTGPIGSVPMFAGTTLKLKAQLVTGEALPMSTAAPALNVPFAAVPPPGAVALLNSMKSRLPAGTTVTTGKLDKTTAPPATVRVMKALPPSYTQAFPFSRPRDQALFINGDGYGCVVEGQAPIITVPSVPPPPPPKTIAWGQIISYILRQPQLAQACGLVYSTTLMIDPALRADTSWVFFVIDTSVAANPFATDAAMPDTVRSYAARLPAIAGDRKLFAATLFPVVPSFSTLFADPDSEAQTYDDGFAQIVHSHQPPTFDTATGGTDGMAPGAEPGIQLAWDDEQVTIWLDRQVGLLRDRASQLTTLNNAESPLGVIGYCVDVSPAGAGAWTSLCGVTGSLPFSGANPSGTGTTPLGPNAELFVTPSPVRANPGTSPDPAWMPLYFTAWRGTSLVVHDGTISKISPGTTPMPANALQQVDVPPPLYGNSYDFRVRLVDLTGGGPRVGDTPFHPGLAPIATAPFRRYIPPKALEVVTTPPPPQLPAQPAAVRTITKLAVQRPRMGYPEAIFARVSPSIFQGASLDALIAAAKTSGRALGVPDPDVDRFSVAVEAAIPDHDTGPAGSLPGDIDGTKWRIVYSITEQFPAGTDPTVTLALKYLDVPDITAMTPPADNARTLPIPSARDIRIRLTPLCLVKSNYYGTPEPPAGLVSDYITRKEAASEGTLFPVAPAQQLRACYLQPGGDLASLLAQSLGLTADGLTLAGTQGKRVVFGNSGALRCTLSPDRSTLTFTNANELLDHWIVALIIDIARDWTWEGFAKPALTVSRDSNQIGTLVFPGVVAPSALGDIANPTDRTTTRLVFLDAVSPQPAPGTFPDVLNPQYTITAAFPRAAALTQTYTTLRLPITTPPAQTPKVVSTGVAESPYVAAADYSSTQLRDRYLWIEFDTPIADSTDDTYFGRILAYGPDPLLAAQLLPPFHAPDLVPEPSLAIDPEPVRVVFAGEDSDDSGLDAMMQLTPASATTSGADGVYFLLPLPAGLTEDSLELFGFWTYEFRVGHAQKWSTAQGRYGRPLQLAGIQHPSPRLTCTVWRNQSGVTVSAPHAVTLLDGQSALSAAWGDPQTVLWFMLYTQVTQTDGVSQRNVLLNRQCEDGRLTQPAGAPQTLGLNREPRGKTTFDQTTIDSLLSLLGLPLTSPLSVLAVEVLPGPRQFPADGSGRAAEASAAGDTVAAGEDPLGRQLGLRRILRTSPLVAVPAIC